MPIEGIQKSQPEQWRILLQGAPGTGKTTFACGFPNIIAVDFDHKLPRGTNAVPFWDRAFTDTIKSSSPFLRDKVFAWFEKNMKELQATDTLLFDSWGAFQGIINDALHKEVDVKSGDGAFRFYNLKNSYSAKMALLFRSLKCNVIVTCHETTKGDNMTSVRPLQEGKFGDELPGHFTDHYRSVIQQVRDPAGAVKREYAIMLQPDVICDCFCNPDLGEIVQAKNIKYIPNNYADYKKLYTLPV